ncbi:hypothetical protein HX13_22480 [Chryseobacterium sp. P1-3]|nr:hypothetical protein HX13_22480 [Chryseobacterium sp. P1-3]
MQKVFKFFFVRLFLKYYNVLAYLKALLRLTDSLVFQWGKDNNFIQRKTSLVNIKFIFHSYFKLKGWQLAIKIINKCLKGAIGKLKVGVIFFINDGWMVN